MKILENFRQELTSLIAKYGFNVEDSESGILAIKPFALGKKIIFFETIKRGRDELSVRIRLCITNEQVQSIHALVNERIANTYIFSIPISIVSKYLGIDEPVFERKIINGVLGSEVSKESIEVYFKNLSECMEKIVEPFFNRFSDQHSFSEWLNKPILEGTYYFEKSPIWKDAITSLKLAKILGTNDYERLYKLWLDQNLLVTDNFNTREEINRLDSIFSQESFPLT